MQCELIAEVEGRERFVELASGWLTEVLPAVFPDLDRRLAEGRVLREVERASVRGEPGTLWATLNVNKRPDVRGWRRALYTPRAWQRFLEGLAGCPLMALMEIVPLGDDGEPDWSAKAYVRVDRMPEAPAWVRFRFEAGSAALRAPGAASRWTAFARRRAEQVLASSGRIDHASDETALERAVGASPYDTIPKAREVLRGYSWVTVVAAELAGRLGGPANLAAKGVFHEVTELGHGAVWLQATAEPSGYEGAAVRRVFEALAPMLITGLATEVYRDVRPLVRGVDAADYR
jgi:hypothetical protein